MSGFIGAAALVGLVMLAFGLGGISARFRDWRPPVGGYRKHPRVRHDPTLGDVWDDA